MCEFRFFLLHCGLLAAPPLLNFLVGKSVEASCCFADVCLDCNFPLLLCLSALCSSLVASYPFNGNANDEIDSSNNGQFPRDSDPPVPTSDRCGNTDAALHFDGRTYIWLPRNASAFASILSTQQISVSVWFLVESFGTTGVFPILDAGNGDWNLECEAAFCILSFAAGCRSYFDYSLAPFTWYHLIAMRSASSGRRMFINGQELPGYVGQKCDPSLPALWPDGLLIGWESCDTFGNAIGAMDDLRFFDTILTPREISVLYHDECSSAGRFTLRLLVLSLAIFRFRLCDVACCSCYCWISSDSFPFPSFSLCGCDRFSFCFCSFCCHLTAYSPNWPLLLTTMSVLCCGRHHPQVDVSFRREFHCFCVWLNFFSCLSLWLWWTICFGLIVLVSSMTRCVAFFSLGHQSMSLDFLHAVALGLFHFFSCSRCFSSLSRSLSFPSFALFLLSLLFFPQWLMQLIVLLILVLFWWRRIENVGLRLIYSREELERWKRGRSKQKKSRKSGHERQSRKRTKERAIHTERKKKQMKESRRQSFSDWTLALSLFGLFGLSPLSPLYQFIHSFAFVSSSAFLSDLFSRIQVGFKSKNAASWSAFLKALWSCGSEELNSLHRSCAVSSHWFQLWFKGKRHHRSWRSSFHNSNQSCSLLSSSLSCVSQEGFFVVGGWGAFGEASWDVSGCVAQWFLVGLCFGVRSRSAPPAHKNWDSSWSLDWPHQTCSQPWLIRSWGHLTYVTSQDPPVETQLSLSPKPLGWSRYKDRMIEVLIGHNTTLQLSFLSLSLSLSLTPNPYLKTLRPKIRIDFVG